MQYKDPTKNPGKVLCRDPLSSYMPKHMPINLHDLFKIFVKDSQGLYQDSTRILVKILGRSLLGSFRIWSRSSKDPNVKIFSRSVQVSPWDPSGKIKNIPQNWKGSFQRLYCLKPSCSLRNVLQINVIFTLLHRIVEMLWMKGTQ